MQTERKRVAAQVVIRRRRRWGAPATFVAIIVLWEIAAHLAPPSHFQGSPLVPSWEFIFTTGLKGISDHWTVDWLAPRPEYGGEETYLGAFLAIAYHSALTLGRLLMGLALGLVVGLGLGLAISYSATFREIAWTPFNFLRMVPLLTAIPLFQFWFGANTEGTTIFVAYGVAVLLIVATIVAVRNVPDRFIESARTLGASRLATYRTVVVPATLPELRTSLLLAAGLSWSVVIGGEYLGLSDGLGRILITAEYFTNTGRMMVIALLIIVYSVVTFAVLDALARRALRWMPRLDQASVAATALPPAVPAPATPEIPPRDDVPPPALEA